MNAAGSRRRQSSMRTLQPDHYCPQRVCHALLGFYRGGGGGGVGFMTIRLCKSSLPIMHHVHPRSVVRPTRR